MDLRPIPRAEALRLLASAPVGRIVFTERALPAIRPVPFTLDGDDLVLRGGPDAGLTSAVHGNVVAFQTDEIDPVSRSGWSVTVTGQAHQVEEPSRLERLGAALGSWVPGDRGYFIRLPTALVDGRHVGPCPGGCLDHRPGGVPAGAGRTETALPDQTVVTRPTA
jgi:uncharacterized protein